MARAGLILLAPVVVALGLVQATVGQTPAKKFVTKDGQRPTGLFVPGVMVGKTLYISGKGDYRPDADFPEKVNNCLNEIRQTLQMAGLDMEHVVKSFVYLEDHEKFGEFNKHYAKFFPKNPPARTTLGVAQVPGESRLEITCIAYSDLAERKSVGEPPAGFPLSPAVLAGDTLYVSGKGDHLPGGGHPATFEEQVRQAMRNVETTLKQAGLDFRHVVMSHVFLDSYDNLEVADKVYNEFFEDGNEAACATVFVDWIPGGSHVEVTCVATTDLSARKVVRPEGLTNGRIEAAVTASPAVWAGNTLYMSGLSGFEPTKGVVTADLDAQFHQMARNHVKVLDAAGLKLEDIVSGCVYLRNMEDYQPMNAIYRQYFSAGPGVRTCLMPNAGYEKNDIRVQASFIAARTR
ncbi:MAG: RidA family protein [Planctomycetes bacterium]|nr:RidA family protein [Planctomycetota bacterium]